MEYLLYLWAWVCTCCVSQEVHHDHQINTQGKLDPNKSGWYRLFVVKCYLWGFNMKYLCIKLTDKVLCYDVLILSFISNIRTADLKQLILHEQWKGKNNRFMKIIYRMIVIDQKWFLNQLFWKITHNKVIKTILITIIKLFYSVYLLWPYD